MTSLPRTLARVLPCNRAGIADAAKRLKEGLCVAFPTETVYGLGAHAMDESAVLSIFTYKGRPLTDPLIVHVVDASHASELLELTPEGLSVFNVLASKFWPGPLTIVSKACPAIPAKVTASTGFVGVRCPAHPIAQALLQEAGIPIAAPSANRFGHVSPTTAQHVLDDLGMHPIAVLLDSDDKAGSGDAEEGGTDVIAASSDVKAQVGIESTVIKIDDAAQQIIVYRRGGIPVSDLASTLQANRLGHYNIHIVSQASEPSQTGLEAPGQLLTHYAPDVATYLVAPADARAAPSTASPSSATAAGTTDAQVPSHEPVDVTHAGVIDFGGRLARLKPGCLWYLDLSGDSDPAEAARGLYNALRQSETVPGVKTVIMPDLGEQDGTLWDALRDRMFRAASGKYIVV